MNVSGQVKGEIIGILPEDSGFPVLVWEQAGLRCIIAEIAALAETYSNSIY
jgi:hypothetical protein